MCLRCIVSLIEFCGLLIGCKCLVDLCLFFIQLGNLFHILGSHTPATFLSIEFTTSLEAFDSLCEQN